MTSMSCAGRSTLSAAWSDRDAPQYGALPGFGGNWRKIAQVWSDMSLQDYLSFTFSWLTGC